MFHKGRPFLDLTKPRLVMLVLLSTMVGYYLALDEPKGPTFFWLTLLGTALSAGGSMALNQWMESDRDARMNRTAGRPLPTKRLTHPEAFIFGIILSISGVALLYFQIHPLAALTSALTVVSYLLFYTPLKPITAHSTLVGAIPGAIPPMIGWSAVQGQLPIEAWILFAIIFFWQMPHFLAISWMYRHEFAAADFRVLAVLDAEGKKVAAEMVLYSALLLPVSLLPTWIGLTGKIYFAGALVLGIVFLMNARKCLNDIDHKAPLLFRTSLIYLTVLLILMTADKQ